MRSSIRLFGGRTISVFVLVLVIELIGGRVSAAPDRQDFQLEVIINGVPANMIGSFTRFSDGRIGATAEELENVGLKPAPGHAAKDFVFLDEIASLKYDYDVRRQRILITVGDGGRITQTIDLMAASSRRLPRAESGWGTVLNYDLFTTTNRLQNFGWPYFSGTSLTLNARAFSPYGTLEQSAIVRAGLQQPVDFVRLNTSYRYSDQNRMITYGAGDLINGGLTWSRPIRIGGLQAQSNFALRPDIITAPLPTLVGSAAVPSTVDVYVNNINTFSQQVAPGPFSVSNVPLINGAGNAELVIRDSAGHETRTSTPFYASANLLAPGLSSWSVEGGLPRISYGSTSDVYVTTPVGSATLRRGIYDGLTVEAHIEGGAGIANSGVGAVVRTGTFGVASAAIAASKGGGASGLQGYLSYETQLFGLNIYASSQRTFGTYEDLASATARLQTAASAWQTNYGLFAYIPQSYSSLSNSLAYISGIYNTARAPLALDRITVGAPMPFDRLASLSVSFIHLKYATGDLSNILTASYSRSLPYSASLSVTLFRDMGSSRNTGIFAGLSFPLGDSVSASTGVSNGLGGTTFTADAAKSQSLEAGSYGWRVRESRGAVDYRDASASYRSNYGTIQAGVSQSGSTATGALELRGSIVSMDRSVFFSNWIDDGFAVVSTGAPGVQVLNENQPIGVTDSRGMLLVPALRSYQTNKISIDPTNLPVDSEIATTREVVAPADRAGVSVKFDVHEETTAALVIFVRKDGSVVPAGASGRIKGGEEFVVGYDGQAYIKNLTQANEADIDFGTGQCRASFPFEAHPGEQVRIPGVACR